jgi:hypothetical protein
VLFCLLAKNSRNFTIKQKKGLSRELVVKRHMSNPWRRLRPLPAAPFVVHRRYVIEVPRRLPSVPLAALLPLPRCALRVLYRGAEADARGTAQVLNRGSQAVARGSRLLQVLHRGDQAAARKTVPYTSQVLDCGAKAVSRGAARCASHVLYRGAQAGTQP